MTIPNPPQQSASSQAITALVLSILGLPCCLLGPIGWYLGNQELKAVREGRSPAAGEGLAQAAVIIGIIATVLAALQLIWVFFFGGLAILAGLSGAAGT
ncbi:MAG TPA: DUF4190 domain-containing protein [Thermoanaerobaculia bacterium]|nr:DUF4190 domain-containing protein [Thermoanaerobaculia bacterium]